jgi:hypothetical protein
MDGLRLVIEASADALRPAIAESQAVILMATWLSATPLLTASPRVPLRFAAAVSHRLTAAEFLAP